MFLRKLKNETENSKLQQFNGAVLMTGLIAQIDEMKLFEV